MGRVDNKERNCSFQSFKNSRVQLNLLDLRIGPDESTNVIVIATDNLAALRAFFTPVKDRRKEKVCL